MCTNGYLHLLRYFWSWWLILTKVNFMSNTYKVQPPSSVKCPMLQVYPHLTQYKPEHVSHLVQLCCMESVNFYGGVCRCRGGAHSQDVIYSLLPSLWTVSRDSIFNLLIPEPRLCWNAAWKSLPWWIFQYEGGNIPFKTRGWHMLRIFSIFFIMWWNSYDQFNSTYSITFLIKELTIVACTIKYRVSRKKKKKKKKHYNTCNNNNCIEQHCKTIHTVIWRRTV